jgi:4,5-dihydroxyphthalate decarboxylase
MVRPHTLLATYPATAALKRGEVESPLVQLDFADVLRAYTGFKSLVRDGMFDIGELAIVTYLQARSLRKPYVLLPVVLVARHQHHSLVYNPARGPLPPSQLNGKRIGVRGYTQTTATWLRGILEEDYGVDCRCIRWVTFEDPHISEYREPAWVQRAGAGKQLRQMLLDGELDAAIFGNEDPGHPLQPVIPEADAAAAEWAVRHGGTPINHMVVVRESLSATRPEIVREVFRLLVESMRVANDPVDGDLIPCGVEHHRPMLELIIDYAARQGLIPRRLSVDELFDDTTRRLGELAAAS